MNLLNKINEAKKLVRVGGIYYHHKNINNQYIVLDVGINESDEKPVVIYRSLGKDKITWIRDVDVWNSKITINNKQIDRFSLVEQM